MTLYQTTSTGWPDDEYHPRTPDAPLAPRKYKRRSVRKNSRQRKALLQKLLDRQCGKCSICGLPLALADANIDHKKPISKGGTNKLNNLGASHIACNAAKGDQYE